MFRLRDNEILHHRQLEPKPIFGRCRHMRYTPPRWLKLSHEFVQGKLEWICGIRVQHVGIIDGLQVIAMRFGQSKEQYI